MNRGRYERIVVLDDRDQRSGVPRRQRLATARSLRIRSLDIEARVVRQVERRAPVRSLAVHPVSYRDASVDVVAKIAGIAALHGRCAGVVAILERKRRAARSELRALQSRIEDEAAIRERRIAHIRKNELLRLPVAARRARGRNGRCERTGIRQNLVSLAPPGTGVHIPDTIVPVVVERAFQMQSAAEQARTGKHADAALLIVPVARFAALNLGLKAFEILLQHQVDHTGDGVRPPLRGRSTRDHFNAVQQDGGHLVEIDLIRVEDGGDLRHETLAIDQNEGARLAEPAQIRVARSGGRRADAVGLRRGGSLECRHLVQHLQNIGRALLLQAIRAHDRGGCRRGVAAALDARPRDQHLLKTFAHGCRRVTGRCVLRK